MAEFREADISDWMFTRNGKIVGGETIKPLLKAMPKATRTRFARGWKPLKAGQDVLAKTRLVG